MNTYKEAAMHSTEALQYYRSINREAPVKKLYHIYHKRNSTSAEFVYFHSVWMAEWKAKDFITDNYLPVLNNDECGYWTTRNPFVQFDGRDIAYYIKGVLTDNSPWGYMLAEDIKPGAQDVYAVAMISHDTYVDPHPDDRNEDDFPGIVELIDRINAGEQLTTISVL